MSDSENPKPPASYRVRDEELLLDFYKRLIWNRIIPRIPASITPNSLTIVGQICAVLSAIATWLAVTGSPIFYLISCVLLLAYLTFDNIDGAHARRTKQTSILGEFLDHGLDGLASTAVLIMTGLILRLDATWLVLLCTLGAFGFVALFWEQFRTGLLVIPRFSSTEGVTILVVYQLVCLFAGSPTWLHFSLESITVGTVLVAVALVGYAGAAIPSVLRAAKVGVPAWELIPLVALMGTQIAFGALGSNPFIPAITVGLIGADMTCRLIIMRYRGDQSPFISPILWLSVLPLFPALVLPNAWTATGWAVLSLAVAVLSYSKNLWFGGNELLEKGREARTA